MSIKDAVGIMEIGDIQPTEMKLRKACGFEPTYNTHTRDAQNKEMSRYLAWEKTGKLNRYTGKVTNEIIITEIYDTPLPKDDKRFNEGSQEFIDELKTLILSLGSFELSYTKLINDYIINMNVDVDVMDSNALVYYKSYLFGFLRSKIISALNQLNKEIPAFNWDYAYICKYVNHKTWTTPTKLEISYIDSMKEIIRGDITLKHNAANHTSAQWNSIAFRYRNLLYRRLNMDISATLGIESLYKIISVQNPSAFIISPAPINTPYIRAHMQTYIDARSISAPNVLAYHAAIFNN
jgi:hypothetical protein